MDQVLFQNLKFLFSPIKPLMTGIAVFGSAEWGRAGRPNLLKN
jgi:hypothetical protein